MIIDKIKTFFIKAENQTGSAPEGTCPNCWGRNEWNEQYYELRKDKHNVPGSEKYNSFINKIVEEHVNTTHKHEDLYVCTTCDKTI